MLSAQLGLAVRGSTSRLLVAAMSLVVLACGPQAAPPAGSGGSQNSNSGGAGGGSSGGASPSGGGGSSSGGASPSGSGGSSSGGATPSGGGGSGGASGGGSGGAPSDDGVLSLLVFARTTEYRHESIEAGVGALLGLADERGWQLVASEDPEVFSDESLAPLDVVIFLSTTGDVLDAEQEAAFERFIQSGKGFVGVHAASDTEYDWPWYGELVGAYFEAHPAVQEASIEVEDGLHPATVGLPSPWIRTDEWYGFQTNPRDHVQVLLTLDETSYEPGEGSMGDDHPIAWCQTYDGGRSFYTGLGHTNESYTDPQFLQHLAGGIEWAATAE
jgi:cytochrome c